MLRPFFLVGWFAAAGTMPASEKASTPWFEGITFPSSPAALWVGRTQMVPFRVGAAVDVDRTLDWECSDPTALEVLRPPTVLAGETLGFLRVRALRAGSLHLRVGQDILPVVLRPLEESDRADAAAHVPRLSGPAEGACVWGRVSVGADWLGDAMASKPRAELRLPGGTKLAPAFATTAAQGAVRHFRWELDTDGLPAGPCDLVVAVDGVASAPVRVVVLHPGPGKVKLGECEETVNAPRPVRFKPKPPAVVADREASGGKAVALPGPDPAWCLPLDVAAPGYYQLALVVRGTLAGGALPSLAVYLGEDERPRATARLAATGWHRIVVGRPVQLDAGAQTLTVRFENDFFAGKESDRNLWLDRYELVRVVEGRAQPVGASVSAPPPAAMSGAPALAMNDSTPASVAALPPPAEMPAEEQAAAAFIAAEAEAVAASEGPVQVALLAPGDGEMIRVQTPLRVRGLCRWENPGGKEPPPETTLLVNGKKAGAPQKGGQPTFLLDPTQLVPGENRLQLESVRADGRRARSAEQTLRRANKLAADPAAVEILYPAEHQTLREADAVVAGLHGGASGIAWVEALVDGQPFGPRVANPAAPDRLALLLPLRSFPPGEHRIQLRAALLPDGKRLVTSSERAVTVAAAEEKVAVSPFPRALRLLDRFAFGAEPRELASILVDGENAWLDARLGPESEASLPATRTAGLAALSLFPPQRKEEGRVALRALAAALLDPNPVRLRFTLWAENHFSTWLAKAGGPAKQREHETFARLGVAPFPELLRASATSPAMLVYLDQQKSFAGKINENYARELLELHTVGVHGGYTQADVTALAGVLTGWMTADESTGDPGRAAPLERAFEFDPALNEGEARRVFGVEFPAATPADRLDRVRLALEMLAGHPATARFIAGKLAAHYLASPPPPNVVVALARIFQSTGGDLRAVLREIPRRPEFWAAPPRLASPQDFALRLARLAGQAQPFAVYDFLRRSGMGLFERPSPDGWPETDAAWADSNALQQRWRFAQSFALPALDAASEDIPIAPRDPVVAQAERQAAVNFAAARLLGHPLSVRSNDAALQLLDLRPGEKRADLARRAAQAVAQLPEVQLR